MPMLEIKSFKIYGLVFGINLFSSSLDPEHTDEETTYKMMQLMIGVFGISIILWDAE